MMAQKRVLSSAESPIVDAVLADKRRARAKRKLLSDAERDEAERTRRSIVVNGIEMGTVKPTAQTERKLRPDPIARLENTGSITTSQAKAAIEIREVYEGLTSSMLARASTAERIAGGSGMPERLAMLHARHYLPWAYYLGGVPQGAALPRYFARVPRQGRCQLALETAIDVIVEGHTIRACEVRHNWRHGFGTEILRYSLAVYTELAGWEQGRAALTAFESEWTASRGRERTQQLLA